MKIKRIYKKGVPKTIVCPYCNAEFPVSRLMFKNNQNGKFYSCNYSLKQRLMGLPPLPPVSNGNGGVLLWDAACFNDKCRGRLPITSGRVPSLLIGVVGASQSGKTHYVTSLIEQLHGIVGSRFKAGLCALDDETIRRFSRELKNPLFRDHMSLPLTVGAVPPLLYNLTVDGSLWNESEDRSITLALFDTAGENMNDEVKLRELASYLSVAAGIIFIVDPLQSNSIRSSLPPNTPLPDVNAESSPSAIIGRIQNLLENRNILTSGKFSTPMAFALTKCDVLQKCGIIPPESGWNSAVTHEGFFNKALHADMEDDMNRIFKTHELGTWNNVELKFPNHAYFGVSATGCSVDPVTGRYRMVAPWRVEDPMLWLLAKLQVIPEK